jgi:hypothetical protein
MNLIFNYVLRQVLQETTFNWISGSGEGIPDRISARRGGPKGFLAACPERTQKGTSAGHREIYSSRHSIYSYFLEYSPSPTTPLSQFHYNNPSNKGMQQTDGPHALTVSLWGNKV